LAGNTALTGQNPALCPLGAFKLSSVGCFQCPPGRWGNTVALTSSSCNGPCQQGYFCPAGSTSATAAICPQGTYSTPAAGGCSSCPPLFPYSPEGATGANYCTRQGFVVGQWGACSAIAPCEYGAQTRDVRCVSASGDDLPLGACGPAPATSQACQVLVYLAIA
jgi:hypothetical protein